MWLVTVPHAVTTVAAQQLANVDYTVANRVTEDVARVAGARRDPPAAGLRLPGECAHRAGGLVGGSHALTVGSDPCPPA